MDWKRLKRYTAVTALSSIITDLLFVSTHNLAERGKMPASIKKSVSLVSVGVVNTTWAALPLMRQPRLREPWSKVSRLLGVTLIAGGAAMVYSSTRAIRIIGIDTPERLVKEGIYGHIRHPTFAALTSISLGWSLFMKAPYSMVALLPFATDLMISGLFEEKTQLEPIFGEEYEAYRKETPFYPRALVVVFVLTFLAALFGTSEHYID